MHLFQRLIVHCLFCFAWVAAQAAEPVLRDLAVLEDKAGGETIAHIAAAAPERFKSLPGGSFAGGFTRSAHWFRFTVAHSGETWLDLQPPVLDDLRLFEPDVNAPGGWRERRTGDTLPVAERTDSSCASCSAMAAIS